MHLTFTLSNLSLYLLIISSIVLTTGCAGPQPRFTPDIQQSFVENPMRRMDTDLLTVYYPAHRQAEAELFAAHLEVCATEISRKRLNQTTRAKIPVIMPEVQFNNAYVSLGSGANPPHMLVPTYFTADLFTRLGMPPDASFISCHEAVHFIQAAEISGIPAALNTVLGYTFTPQLGLDPWFWEGLATYYESRLNPGIGRMATPFWHQLLAAGFADAPITESALHAANRRIPYGGQYLVGSHFISYLAETYGEDKLWEIINRQSNTLLVPFGINVRFYLTYGKSLATLVEEFSEHIQQTHPRRTRPANQQILHQANQDAQWAAAPDGTRALITRGPDQPERLTIWSPTGQLLYTRDFPDVLPPRKLIASYLPAGLSFTADAKHLYFTAISQSQTSEQTLLLHLDLQTHQLHIIAENLRGAGGSITPDGTRYIFPRANGNRHDLAYFDLQTRKIGILHQMPTQHFIVSPRVSPDGTRIAAVVMHGAQADLWLFSTQTGQKLAEVPTSSAQIHRDPAWLNNHTLLAAAEADGRFQIFQYDTRTAQQTQLSDAPYLAMQPFALNETTIAFLNRDGWNWTIDTLSTNDIRVATNETSPTPEPAHTPKPDTYQLHIHEDKPYSQFDGLFIPRLHVPTFTWADTYQLLGIDIGGLDTLGFHAWSLGFSFEFANALPGFSFAYVNTQLAPWYLYFSASQFWGFNAYTIQDSNSLFPEITYRLDRRERQLRAQALRTFYDMPVAFGFLGTELYRPEASEFPTERRTFLGFQAAAQYAAGRGSAHSGTRNLFALGLSAAAYPSQLGSDFSLGDLRAETTINLPLPLSTRHRLRLNTRARTLLGTPDNAKLLRVGGIQPGEVLASNTLQSLELVSDLLPGPLGFSEPLRGYEDYGFATNQLLAAEIDYRYPFIIDRGTASTLGILPAIFLRQLNLELFAATATFERTDKSHTAVGASLDLQVLFWQLPFALRYQTAKRLVDDHALVHTLTLGIGLN